MTREDNDVNDLSATPELADRQIPAGDDFLPRDEVSKLTPEELVRRVKALQPLIRERAPIAEKERRPDDQVWAALRGSGIFYLLIPKQFGGLEADFDSLIDIGMAIAEADASTGWTATFCIEHNWMLAKWPLKAQDELWNGKFPFVIAPYTANPPGQAVAVEGGYKVSAHWKWGTGCMHADHVLGMVLLPQEDGEPVPLSIVVPAEKARILDTWYMAGMQATGSNDVVFEDVFIPEHYAARDIFAGGSDVAHDNPMYRVPFLPFLGLAAAITVIGATRGMVKVYQERVQSQMRTFATTVSMDRPQS
jgi:alkylation response protein AidB-like acyl-CoA dehydrogenase